MPEPYTYAMDTKCVYIKGPGAGTFTVIYTIGNSRVWKQWFEMDHTKEWNIGYDTACRTRAPELLNNGFFPTVLAGVFPSEIYLLSSWTRERTA